MTCFTMRVTDIETINLTIDLSETVKAISEFDDSFINVVNSITDNCEIASPDEIQIKKRKDTDTFMVYGELKGYREFNDREKELLKRMTPESFYKVNDFLIDQFNETMTELSVAMSNQLEDVDDLDYDKFTVKVGFILNGKSVFKIFDIDNTDYSLVKEDEEVYFP